MAYNLKDEKDVELYLKNLYTEYNYGCYGQKNPEVCHLLAEYCEAITQDFEKAAEVYKKNCDTFDYPKSCAKIGGWMLIGRSCEKDVLKAFNYMKKACSLNDETGCTNGGIVALTHSSVQGEDRLGVINNGVEMLNKACTEKKIDRACFFLASFWRRGIQNLVEPNYFESYKAALKSCELGNPHSCTSISYMHETGLGAQQDPKLADTFKKRAKELNDELKYVQKSLNMGQGFKF